MPIAVLVKLTDCTTNLGKLIILLDALHFEYGWPAPKPREQVNKHIVFWKISHLIQNVS